MHEYTITYKIGDGTKKKVIYEAVSKSAAKSLALDDGLHVVSINENFKLSGLDRFLAKNFPSVVRLRKKTILVFFTQLFFLLEAEVNLVSALKSMKRGAKDNKYRKFLSAAYKGISEGKQLSDLLTPNFGFEPEIQMQIQSGERSGNLVSAIKTIIDRLERESKTKSAVAKQMAYPVVVIIIMIGVVYYILTNVVPSLTDILTETGGELPQITIALINISTFAEAYGLQILGGIIVFVFVLLYFKKKEFTGYYIDKVFLKLPLFGEINMLTSLTRYFYVASNMLAGEIPLINALEIAAKSVSNKYMKKELGKFPLDIKSQGTSLDILMANFNPTSTYSDLVNTGLTTGKIEEIFEKLSQESLEQSDAKVKTLTTMMEPVITIVLGGVVALIVFSLFIPMFAVLDSM